MRNNVQNEVHEDKETGVIVRFKKNVLGLYLFFKAYVDWIINRISQILLTISAGVGFYLYKACSYPYGTLAAVTSMFASEVPQLIAFVQWTVGLAVYILNGGFKKMTFLTKTLTLLNLFFSGLQLRLAFKSLKSLSIFENALKSSGIDTKLFSESVKFDMSSAVPTNSVLGPLLKDLSSKTALILTLFPFLGKIPKLFERRSEALKHYENMDHSQPMETKPYADMETEDELLMNQIKSTPKSVRLLMGLVGRGDHRGWMDLDIHRSEVVLKEKETKSFPVVIYVHGGGWVVGDKIFALNGCLDFMVEHFKVVVVKINYRMAPERTVPEQLLDVKRAIHWVKTNIDKYGGDPTKTCLMGESAGGHLTALTSVTNNTKKFARLFEHCPVADEARLQEILENSSVDLAVDIGGVHDLSKGDNKFANFSGTDRKNGIQVIMEEWGMKRRYKDDPAFFHDFSPTALLLDMVEKNDGEDYKLPPFMLIHGDKDTLTSVEDAKEFFNVLKRYRFKTKSQVKDVFVDVTDGHHAIGYIRSPRAASMAIAVASFMKNYFGTVEPATVKTKKSKI